MRLVPLAAVVLLLTAAHAIAADVRGSYEGTPYRLDLPDSPAAARPLVVALHGCAQTADDFARGTRLDRAAGRRGVRVLYPEQTRLANAARCWNWFRGLLVRSRSAETDQLADLIRHVQQSRGFDTREVVVIGLSAGAYMAVNLACAAPDIVVGVGAAAGGPYGCAATSGSPLRCMRGERLDGADAAERCGTTNPKLRASLWHGEGDSVVSPANLTALTTMFLRLHGLVRDARPRGAAPAHEAPGTTERVDGAVRTVYRGRDGRAVIETWLVSGMGHAWSGGDARGSHTHPAGPDATDAMLRFLLDP